DILSLQFFNVKAGKQLKKDQYGGQSIVDHPDLLTYQLNSKIRAGLESHNDFKRLFIDVLTTGLEIAKQYDLKQAFTLYQQYDRKDVCRLLRSEEHTSELQSRFDLVCRLLLDKKTN